MNLKKTNTLKWKNLIFGVEIQEQEVVIRMTEERRTENGGGGGGGDNNHEAGAFSLPLLSKVSKNLLV